MKTRTVATLLLSLAFLAPVASASHDDPTHGVLPHSISDRPFDVHAVDVSTPHPYVHGETYEYTIAVDGAESIRVHFENYDVNGYYNSWRQVCYGSILTIYDANTGLELDSFCGSQAADWWTPDYETDALLLEFSADSPWREHYGFDVYEVLTNGAEPIATVPKVDNLRVAAYPSVSVEGDPADPESLASRIGTSATMDLGGVYVNNFGAFQLGSFWDCSNSCTYVDGFKLKQSVRFTVSDEAFVLGLHAIGAENDDGLYDVNPTVSCEHNKKSC